MSQFPHQSLQLRGGRVPFRKGPATLPRMYAVNLCCESFPKETHDLCGLPGSWGMEVV